MSLRAALTPQRERQKKLVLPQRVALTPQRGAEETSNAAVEQLVPGIKKTCCLYIQIEFLI